MIGSVDGARTLPLPAAGRASVIALAVASMTTIQLGAALFDRVGPAGLVALRLSLAALILLPLVRPRVRGRTRSDIGLAPLISLLPYAHSAR
jgi:inner membrane transporter RhtA